MVGAAGFEPTLAESESDVLPLNYAPMRGILYTYKSKIQLKFDNYYSYRRLSIGFNFAALTAGITPDTKPTKIATDIDTTTGQILNGTL